MNVVMKTVSVIDTLDAAPQSVWDAIRRCDHVDRWAPGITACRLEGPAQADVRRV